MCNMRKCLAISVIGAAGVICVELLLTAKIAGRRRESGACEKLGKGIDERLKESKAALEKATAHVQSVFEHIKDRKA